MPGNGIAQRCTRRQDPPNKNRIVILDDDVPLREIMSEIAADEGYDVVALGEGAGLIDAVDRFAPHRIVLDLSIPDRDGIDLMKTLGANRCSVPIVVVSSHPARFLDEVRVLGTALGLDIRAALQKPFEMVEFIASISD